jgi:transposase
VIEELGMTQRPDLSQLSSEEKDVLISALLERVEELERRLGLNSSNSGKPPASDGLKKPSRVNNQREKTGRKSGGQEGHEGTNLRQVANPDKVIDHCPLVCAGCGGAVGVEQATGHRKRQVFDIPQPVVQVTEHRAHSYRCPGCGTEAQGVFPDEVTAAAQYGTTVGALVVYLQAWHLIPEDRLAELMADVFGVELATSTIAAMGQRKAQELAGLAAHIEQAVKQAAVKHLDETGYRIGGVLQWLHVASTWLLTCSRTSGKRGAMLAGVRGIIVHDFWRPYLTMAGVTHALCNAHHLRELKALIDIEKEPWALAMHHLLRRACHAANLARARRRSLKPACLVWFSTRYERILAQGFAFHDSQPPLVAWGHQSRGRPRRRTGHNLLIRLRDHKGAALRFLYDPIVPFTNNQAERDLRMMKVRQKISGGFRSATGAQTFATLRTVLSTARKQGWNILETLTTPPATLVQNLRTA